MPGLEIVEDRTPGYLEAGVRRTIADLEAAGYVTEAHAAHTAAVIELAQIIEQKRKSGRLSTVGNDMRALIDFLDRLVPKREESGVDQLLKDAAEQWAASLEAGP